MTHAIKAVIFDLDDTLFDHYHSLRAGLVAIQKACADLQRYPLDDLTYTYIDLVESLHLQVLQGLLTLDEARIQRIRACFLKYGLALSMDEARAYALLYRETYQSARQIVPGAVALLECLRTDAKIAVITNNTSLEQREKLDTCGLAHLIDVLVISEEVGVIKPDPAIFAITLERLGCSAGETVMVGDAWKTDVIGAHRAGIKPVWLNRFGTACPDPSIATVIDTLKPAKSIAALLLNQ